MNKLLRTGRRWPEAGREIELAAAPKVKSGIGNRPVTGAAASNLRGSVAVATAKPHKNAQGARNGGDLYA